MSKYELKVEQASAYYDEESRIVHIAYQGALSSDVTVQVYDWLETLYDAVGLDTLYGQIFDFREVTEFDESNLSTARRTSSRMNMRMDTSHVPVALIVGDFYHEEILRGAMRIPPEHARKRIVWSEDEALAFLQEWHKNQSEEKPPA